MTVDEVRAILRHHKPIRVGDPSRKRAAVAIVLLPAGDSDSEILLIKRATRPGDPWSGQMALPGGRRDPEDADLLATAIRETREELGIDLAGAELVGQLDDHAPRTPVLPPIVVRPFVFVVEGRPSVVPNREVDRHLWVRVTALAASQGETRVRVLGVESNFPAFYAEGEAIWGMTHRIITDLLNLRSSPA
jgi:8-oxo-dGTP pyrophosphatase MutT (NUDIX family)